MKLGLPKKASADDSPKWWDNAVEVPRAGLPDAELLHRKAKRWRRLVKTALVLFPITCVFLLLALAALMTNSTGEDTTGGPDAFADTRPVAQVAVENWLNSDPSPIPGGELVAWVSAEATDVDPEPTKDGEEFTIEVHKLSVVGANATMYNVGVTLAVTDTTVDVSGSPSLLAAPLVGQRWTGGVWDPTDLDFGTTDEAVTKAITEWAGAYSGTDPELLRLTVRDPDTGHLYLPLMGLTLGDPTVGETAGLWGEDATDEDKRNGDPSTILVQVDFPITYAGQTGTEGSDGAPTASYDLLVVDATTTPTVVAWGPRGSGPTLTPFSNAVSGDVAAPDVEITVDPDATDAPAASGTATKKD